MSQPDERTRALLDRVERLLPPLPVREVAMFGSHAVMLDDAMVVAVFKDHSLLVRVAPGEDETLLSRADASRPAMGGRSMGTGWIRVAADALDSDETLAFWVDRALSHFSVGRSRR